MVLTKCIIYIINSRIRNFIFSSNEDYTLFETSNKLGFLQFNYIILLYSNRDCSRDITRIMCNDCFRQSKHRDHRYKVSLFKQKNEKLFHSIVFMFYYIY